jgi:hypothetical protein
VDTALPKPDDLDLPGAAGQEPAAVPQPALPVQVLPKGLRDELWMAADAEGCGISRDEFGVILASVGAKYNHGLPPGAVADPRQIEAFVR